MENNWKIHMINVEILFCFGNPFYVFKISVFDFTM